jgi:predicted ester cyclase
MELDFDKKKNLDESLKFIHFYAAWVKKVPNRVWSKQQAEVIDSLMLNAQNFQLSREEYLQMVDRAKKRIR